MADLIPITAGSGTIIATDQISSAHFQIVKLATGTADSSALIVSGIGAASNGLRTAPANDITDATYIGDIKFGEALPAGTAVVGALAAGTAIIGSLAAGTAVLGYYTIAVGTAVIGSLAASTALIGGLAVSTAAIGTIALTVGTAVIGTIATGTNLIGGLGISTSQIGVLAIGTNVVGALAAGTNIIGGLGVGTAIIGTLAVGTAIIGYVAGDVAHDGADSGNPLKVGGKAVNFDGTVPGTAVAENDRTNFITDTYGRQFVEVAHPAIQWANANATVAHTSTIITAPAAGAAINITHIIMSNGATSGSIELVEDVGGTTAVIIGPYYFAPQGGTNSPLGGPIKAAITANVGYRSTGVTTHTVTLGYFVAS